MDSRTPHAGALTRRRALAIGAAAGVTTLAHGGAAPLGALAAPSRRSIGFAPDAFGRGGVSDPVRVAGGFVLVGARDPLAAGAALEVRARRARRAWGPWTRLEAHPTHAPDGGAAPRASDPVWTGRADELQVRSSRRPRRRVTIDVVAVSSAAHAIAGARASAAEANAAQLGAQPPIVPRAAWGGDSVIPREKPSYGSVEVAFVHHTENPNGYGPDDSAAIVLAIAKYHRDTKRWNDIGYNFLVDRFGRIYEGRAGGVDLPVIGAHAQGYNSRSTGISIIGSFSGEAAPPAALESVARLIGWKLPWHAAPVIGTHVVKSGGGAANRYRYGTPVQLQRINGHRDGNATACPGNVLYSQLPALRARAAEVAGTPVVRPRVGLDEPKAARYGDDAAFTGTVTDANGVPQPGVPVRIEKRSPNGRWVKIAGTATDAEGRYQAAGAMRRAGFVRASSLRAVSPPVMAAVVPLIEARAEREQITTGSRVVLRGTVRPSESVTVIIDRRSRGRWKRVAKVRTRRSQSRFAVRRKMAKPGTYRLTARAVHYGRAARATAVIVKVGARTAPTSAADGPGGTLG